MLRTLSQSLQSIEMGRLFSYFTQDNFLILQKILLLIYRRLFSYFTVLFSYFSEDYSHILQKIILLFYRKIFFYLTEDYFSYLTEDYSLIFEKLFSYLIEDFSPTLQKIILRENVLLFYCALFLFYSRMCFYSTVDCAPILQ